MSNEDRKQLDIDREAAESAAKATNDSRGTAKGTRIQVGSTRGKNTQVVSFEAFDDSQPDTLPESVAEFVSLTGISDEDRLVKLLIIGFNDESYTTASDPIAEFINPVWSDELKLGFRTIVRGYAKNAGVSIEDAVALLKPGVEAKHLASLSVAQ